jgi:hypothetical protein
MKKFLQIVTVGKIIAVIILTTLISISSKLGIMARYIFLNDIVILGGFWGVILGAGSQIVFAKKLRWLALGQVLAVITLLFSWIIPTWEKLIARNKGLGDEEILPLWEDALGREYLFSLVTLAGLMIVFDVSYLILIRRAKDTK